MKRIAGFLVLTLLASGCEQTSSNKLGQQEDATKPPAKQQAVEKTIVLPAAPEVPGAVAAANATGVPAAETAKTDNPSAAKTDQAAPAQKSVFGPTQKGEGFSVHIQTQSPQVVGKQGTLLLTLKADSPFKCNDKYPYKFTFEPIDGVSFPNQTVRGMQVQKASATLSVPFSPQQAGNQSVSGDLSFSVCTDDKCLVEKQRLTVSFDVVDPA